MLVNKIIYFIFYIIIRLGVKFKGKGKIKRMWCNLDRIGRYLYCNRDCIAMFNFFYFSKYGKGFKRWFIKEGREMVFKYKRRFLYLFRRVIESKIILIVFIY